MLGRDSTGKASAEHGSALRSLPLAAGQGKGWGGGAFRWESPLPSMARHYARSLWPQAEERAGEGCFSLGKPSAEHGSALRSAVSGGLQFKQLGIAAAFDHQLFVGTAGFDATVGQHQDAISHAHR